MRVLLLVVFTWSLFIANAWAEHEVDHRYSIRGYILDSNQQGISDQIVQVFDGSNSLGQSKTDSAGYYSMHLHLHNEDWGRKLRLRSGSNEAELRVTFDSGDVSTLREHDANFIGDEFVEGKLDRFRIPPWTYPLVGFVLLGFIVVRLEKRRKKKLRESKLEQSDKPSSGSQKKKKKKRKKG